MDRVSPSATFMRAVARHLPAPPSLLLVISAHWETTKRGGGDGAAASGAPAVELLTRAPPHNLLFDYYNFPPEAYEVTWPAPPAPPTLVARAAELLRAGGFAPSINTTRAGLDHGVFMPMMLAFPAAEVPVLQVSLLAAPSPAAHLALGAALAPLRGEGVLILGSGFATHNLGELDRRGGEPPVAAWAADFDAWLASALAGGAAVPRASAAAVHGGARRAAPYEAVAGALARVEAAPHFARAHPTPEHFLPLLVALGAAKPAGDDDQLVHTTPLFSQIVLGAASFASYKFE